MKFDNDERRICTKILAPRNDYIEVKLLPGVRNKFAGWKMTRENNFGCQKIYGVAEGVGFEPTVGLPLLLISSQVPLTTQPPFQPFIYKHLTN